jgi:hypothetical protein
MATVEFKHYSYDTNYCSKHNRQHPWMCADCVWEEEYRISLSRYEADWFIPRNGVAALERLLPSRIAKIRANIQALRAWEDSAEHSDLTYGNMVGLAREH